MLQKLLKYHLTLGCFALMLLSAVALRAQPEEQRFRQITIDQGLSQSTVVAICQDSLGFLWFGTKDGLNLYDGYRFTVFKYNSNDSTSIGGNHIRSLLVDEAGDIWVGASNGSLSRYSHSSQRFQRIQLPTASKSNSQVSTIDAMELGHDGSIWVAALADGLYRIDPKNNRLEHFTVGNGKIRLHSNTITSILDSKDGYLWIGTRDEGLGRYSFKDDSYQLFSEQNGLPESRIYSIFKDFYGNIWVGTQAGSAKFIVEEQKFQPIVINPLNFPTPAVTSFAQNSRRYLWMAVYPQGIIKLDIETLEWLHFQADPYSLYSLTLNDVRKLFVDHNKNLWIGTNGGGINMLPLYQNFTLYRHQPADSSSLPGNSIRSILEDSYGNLYIGFYGGMMVYNKKNNSYKHYVSSPDLIHNLHNSSVYVLREDVDGKIWIGFEGGGIQLFDPITKGFKNYYNIVGDSTSLLNDHVLSILVDSEGKAWFGHHQGLSLLDRNTGKFKHYLNPGRALAGPYVRAIVEDKPGYLWVGTDNGLKYLETATGKFVEFRTLSAPNEVERAAISIYSIYKDSAGVLWIGTQGAGLYRMDYEANGLHFKKSEFTCLCPTPLLTHLTGYGILEDENENLWISSDNGLFKYGKKTKEWQQFTKTDGLQSNEFNASAYYKAKDGRMYFGGINGLNAFYPSNLAFNTVPPPVVLTNFKIFNKPYQLDQDIALIKRLELNHNQNYLTFEFAALDYTAPEKNQYAYQLVGFDEGWIYPGSVRQVTYSNLPPGNYIFKVKAANKDGYWNEAGAEVKISIKRAYYSSWWFRAMIVFTAVIGLVVLFRSRLAGYKERQKLLEEQLKTQSQKLQLEKLKTEYAVSQALIEGQNQEQKRISEDLHDGLGQTLTAASLNLMALDSSIKNLQQEKTTEYIVNLQLLLNSAIQEVRNISHNLMPYLLAEEGLQAALDEMCHRAMKSSNMKIHLHIMGSDERIVESQEINFYRIVQEIISNTQKHSGAQNLSINYNVGPNSITLVSEDDGIGFDPTYLKSARNLGLGIKNIQVRVQLMKGKINIATKPGRGVRIEIEVPRI